MYSQTQNQNRGCSSGKCGSSQQSYYNQSNHRQSSNQSNQQSQYRNNHVKQDQTLYRPPSHQTSQKFNQPAYYATNYQQVLHQPTNSQQMQQRPQQVLHQPIQSQNVCPTQQRVSVPVVQQAPSTHTEKTTVHTQQPIVNVQQPVVHSQQIHTERVVQQPVVQTVQQPVVQTVQQPIVEQVIQPVVHAIPVDPCGSLVKYHTQNSLHDSLKQYPVQTISNTLLRGDGVSAIGFTDCTKCCARSDDISVQCLDNCDIPGNQIPTFWGGIPTNINAVCFNNLYQFGPGFASGIFDVGVKSLEVLNSKNALPVGPAGPLFRAVDPSVIGFTNFRGHYISIGSIIEMSGIVAFELVLLHFL